ncbi:magnesium transporter CorA family protein [Gordonia jinhuaensis]|uniref:Magnesium transporter n=1 Tax=Gordonia jinhuaensis TaxID=1517702 RepID=A0A916WTG4_9ACTN|nr:magnesium transporter CorA family protein [Gordonia jinhuaensis]GGB28976.1 magnesium transporter [Gordonia jinhuaensis]
MTAVDPKHPGVQGQVWRNGKLLDDFSLEQVSECLHDDSLLIWADLLNPSHEEMSKLADELDLDQWAVEDTLAKSERVKVTRYSSHLFMTLYSIEISDDKSGTAEGVGRVSLHRISAFVKKNALITVRLSDGFDMAEVVDRWNEIGGQEYGVGSLVHGLLDVIVDEHLDAIQDMDDRIEALEELLFDDDPKSGKTLQREVYTYRKDLEVMRRVILPMRDVIGSIHRNRGNYSADGSAGGEALDAAFSDLYDHSVRSAEWTESLRDMVSSIFDTNLSIQDARLNVVMKKLSGWGAIIAVPTLITGFYGQNVPYPGYDTWGGYITSTVIAVVAVVGLYISFKKRDWL